MLIWLVLMSVLFVHVHVNADGSANDDTEALFNHLPTLREPAGKHTFIFWIQGDSDHFVDINDADTHPSLVRAGDSTDDLQIGRADKFDAQSILHLARMSYENNIILVHDQRGSSAWYKRDLPWATRLVIYSRGENIYENEVNEVNSAHPNFLTSLIDFADGLFPSSQFHLIYRGHDFFPNADHFDYSHPDDNYNLHQFVNGVRDSRRFLNGDKTVFSTITFAACSMAYLELASALAPYSEYMIAPPAYGPGNTPRWLHILVSDRHIWIYECKGCCRENSSFNHTIIFNLT